MLSFLFCRKLSHDFEQPIKELKLQLRVNLLAIYFIGSVPEQLLILKLNFFVELLKGVLKLRNCSIRRIHLVAHFATFRSLALLLFEPRIKFLKADSDSIESVTKALI